MHRNNKKPTNTKNLKIYYP